MQSEGDMGIVRKSFVKLSHRCLRVHVDAGEHKMCHPGGYGAFHSLYASVVICVGHVQMCMCVGQSAWVFLA